jgi:hypothetical protein
MYVFAKGVGCRPIFKGLDPGTRALRHRSYTKNFAIIEWNITNYEQVATAPSTISTYSHVIRILCLFALFYFALGLM